MYVNTTRSLIAAIILVVIFVSFSASADPTASNISISPEEPTPLSTITITVNILGEDISSVEISISECDDETCFVGGTESMTEIEAGVYQAEYTLQDTQNRSDHIEITSIEVVDNGTTYNLQEDSWKFDLSVESNNGDESDGSTPGFELLTFIVSIGIIIIFYARKRLK